MATLLADKIFSNCNSSLLIEKILNLYMPIFSTSHRIFVIWHPASTSSLGHHQIIVEENERTEKLSAMR